MRRTSYIFLAALFLAGVFFAGGALAENRAWRVLSRYQSPFPGKADSEITWRFTCKTDSGRKLIEVADAAGRVRSRAVMVFDDDGKVVGEEIYRDVREGVDRDVHVYSPTLPVPAVGSLLPLDWFNQATPFVPVSGERECEVSETVGRARFLTRLKITTTELPLDQALAEGMVREEMRDSLVGKRIFLVEARRLERGKTEGSVVETPLFRQLWAEGESFWLYEEKGLRQSWCLNS